MNEQLIERVAKALYDDYAREEEFHDVPTWENLDSFSTAAYRNRAASIIQALGLRLEWGVRTLQHIGDLDQPYQNFEIARIVFEEAQDEEPETEPRLISKISTEWEVVQE